MILKNLFEMKYPLPNYARYVNSVSLFKLYMLYKLIKRAVTDISLGSEELKKLSHILAQILFACFDSLRPINNLSVIKGRVFLG